MSGLINDTNHLLRALVGNFVLATIGCNGRFGLCIFGSPYNLGHKELLGKKFWCAGGYDSSRL